MVTVKVHREVKYLLEEYKNDGESMDAVVNRLLDEVSSDMDNAESNRSSININLTRDTMERLKSYSIRENEPYGRILHRALLLVDH